MTNYESTVEEVEVKKPRAAQSALWNGATSTVAGLAGAFVGVLVAERFGIEAAALSTAAVVGMLGAFAKLARDAAAEGKLWGKLFEWVG